jgi:hypothetical protein
LSKRGGTAGKAFASGLCVVKVSAFLFMQTSKGKRAT